MSGDLIDTTEMYLKTVYELEEESVPALRARIVERLGQSGPTVSETVARLERDGLLRMGAGRQIHFTDEGFRRAEGVMRRHRLAECLLLDVIGLEWVNVHDEACRWEHVVSDSVADKIEVLLHNPDRDPFGNPIPRAQHTAEMLLGDSRAAALHAEVEQMQTLARVADTMLEKTMNSAISEADDGDDMHEKRDAYECERRQRYIVVRIAERVQACVDDLMMLDEAGFRPGVCIEFLTVQADEIWVRIAAASGEADSLQDAGTGGSEYCPVQDIAISRYLADGIYIKS